MKKISIPSLSFFESVIHPAFADVLPDGFPYKGTLNEFTLMDDVPTKRPIVDIRRHQNIMQRRDASCDIIYKKTFGATTRSIATEEIYGATKFCKNEFYQGALKDWRAKDPLFGNKILPYFQGAVNTDIATNSYFGDVDRIVPPNAAYSTNIYDGVFKWIGKYIDNGLIPASQTLQISDTNFYGNNGPGNAYTLLKTMYERQPTLMRPLATSDKRFYVSQEIADAYEDYLIQTGATAGNISYLQDGVKKLSYKSIEIVVEPLWAAVITELNDGNAGSAAILTLHGNFVFATDKNYGEGEDDQSALVVWYEFKDMTWYYQLFLKAGTQIALPEFIVVALSNWSDNYGDLGS